MCASSADKNIRSPTAMVVNDMTLSYTDFYLLQLVRTVIFPLWCFFGSNLQHDQRFITDSCFHLIKLFFRNSQKKALTKNLSNIQSTERSIKQLECVLKSLIFNDEPDSNGHMTAFPYFNSCLQCLAIHSYKVHRTYTPMISFNEN